MSTFHGIFYKNKGIKISPVNRGSIRQRNRIISEIQNGKFNFMINAISRQAQAGIQIQ